MRFCPNCGIGLSNIEKESGYCQNCKTDIKEELLEEEKEVWVSAKVECNLCSKEWVAVYHMDSNELQCPSCENMTIFNVIEVINK